MILRRDAFANGIELEVADLLPTDHDWVYSLVVDPERSAAWRNRGRPPAPGDFLALLFGGVRHSAVAWSAGRRLALLQLLGDEREDGHLDLGVLAAGSSPLNSLAIASYLTYAFETFRLRKVYVATSAASLDQIGRLDEFARREACLRDHLVVRGAAMDVSIFAVLPADVARFVAASRQPSGRAELAAWLGDREWLDGDDGLSVSEQLDSLDLTELMVLVEQCLGRAVEDAALDACVSRAEVLLLVDHLAPSTT